MISYCYLCFKHIWVSYCKGIINIHYKALLRNMILTLRYKTQPYLTPGVHLLLLLLPWWSGSGTSTIFTVYINPSAHWCQVPPEYHLSYPRFGESWLVLGVLLNIFFYFRQFVIFRLSWMLYIYINIYIIRLGYFILIFIFYIHHSNNITRKKYTWHLTHEYFPSVDRFPHPVIISSQTSPQVI